MAGHALGFMQGPRIRGRKPALTGEGEQPLQQARTEGFQVQQIGKKFM